MVTIVKQNYISEDVYRFHKESVDIKIYDYLNKFYFLAKNFNPYYSLLLLQPSVQYVLAGFSPVAKINLDRSLVKLFMDKGLISGFDALDFSKELVSLGLKVDEYGMNSDEISFNFYLYNPELVKNLSLIDSDIVNYQGQNLNTWIKHSLEAGVPKFKLLGLMKGYPNSAIESYLKNVNDNFCNIVNRYEVSNFAELYMLWGDQCKADVINREAIKGLFFSKLAQNDEYMITLNRLETCADEFRKVSQDNFFEKIGGSIESLI